MKTNLKYYLLGLLLVLPSFYWLFNTNYWNMHDDMQILRQLELEKCLDAGQFPCRWSPDPGYQFGYPLLNFYPPLPYLFGQIFRSAGFSFVMSIKMVALLQFVFSYSAMYALGLFLGGGLTGLLAAVFYTYLPYHAVNVYIRGAMNEAWAGVFFPLILLFILKLVKKITPTNIILLSLSFAGLFLSHLPMSLIFSFSLLPLIIYEFFKLPSRQRLSYFFSLSLSSALAVGLCAFFLLPVLLETRHVQINSMFTNYYHFSVHFTTLKQLFLSQFWGDGASVWGSDDGMSFSLGTLHWLILAVSLISAAYYQFIRKQSQTIFPYLFIFAFLFIFTAFMTHNRSTFLWQLFPFIQKIQFPWRFLSLSGFYLALSIPLAMLYLPQLPFLSRRSQSWLICLAIIIFNLHFFRPLTAGPITDSQKLSGKAWENQITSGIYDYLPIWSSRAPNRPPHQPTFDQTDYPLNILGFSSSPGQARLNFDNPQIQTALLPTLYYPNLHLYLDTHSQNYFIDRLFGQPRLILPADNHRLDYFYSDNLLRRLSNIASLVSLWLVINIRLISQWMTPHFKRSRPRP